MRVNTYVVIILHFRKCEEVLTFAKHTLVGDDYLVGENHDKIIVNMSK